MTEKYWPNFHPTFNLIKGSWGQFWPQRSKTRHYFLIGWTYSFIFYLILTNTEAVWNAINFKGSAGVKNDPRNHIGVKIDPRKPFKWLFLGTLSKVNDMFNFPQLDGAPRLLYKTDCHAQWPINLQIPVFEPWPEAILKAIVEGNWYCWHQTTLSVEEFTHLITLPVVESKGKSRLQGWEWWVIFFLAHSWAMKQVVCCYIHLKLD